MPMTPALMQAIAADQAARNCDPRLLTDPEKNDKIRALQERTDMLEGIATFLCNLLQAVEKTTRDAGTEDRSYRRLILDLTHRRWECATPVTIIEPETGAQTFARRAM